MDQWDVTTPFRPTPAPDDLLGLFASCLMGMRGPHYTWEDAHHSLSILSMCDLYHSIIKEFNPGNSLTIAVLCCALIFVCNSSVFQILVVLAKQHYASHMSSSI